MIRGQLVDSPSPDPLVTVIIATYNKASTLRFALQSVLWQRYENYEVWVIGDCCTDNSAEVVKGLNDPRFNWFNLPVNSGYQSVPHNEGLRRARGKYIAYLNHDDLWLPEHLELLIAQLEESRADFAFSILEWVLPYRQSYADIPIYPNAARPPEASATMHRRSIVAEIGFWKLPNEINAIPRAEYFRRAQFMGKQFVFVPSLTVLKFACGGKYDEVGQHEDYFTRIKADPKFIEKELETLLVTATSELERPIRWKRYIGQLANAFRSKLVKMKMDPAGLAVWKRPGSHIQKWRRDHHLD
jgi:glycosyltransferase involved in cell wall biosynthesis